MDLKDIINLGYTATDILDVMGKGQPGATKKIRRALSFGYPAISILKHLIGKDSDSDEAYMTLEEKAKNHEAKRHKKQAVTTGLTAATLAGGLGLLARGGAVASQGAQAAGSILSGTSGNENSPLPSGGLTPTTGPSVGSESPAVSPLSVQGIQNQAMNRGQNPSIPVTNSQTPPIETAQSSNPVTDMDFFQTKLAKENPSGIIQFIEHHQKSGKSPEETYDIIRQTRLHGPRVKKFEEESGLPFSEAIKQVYGSNQLDLPEITIEKGSKVITPSGQIGDVFHQKDGTSIVDEGNRRSASKTDDLIPMPKSWENIQVDLSKVPEQDRSSNLQQVAATEDGKQIVMSFWEKGDKPKMYIYRRKDGKPMDAEILKTISEESDIAVTNGMSFYGGWSTKDPSRGSAFHHRLKMLSQSAQDEDDPSKPFVFERAPVAFKHGFLVAAQQELNRAEREFNDKFKPKKSKKS